MREKQSAKKTREKRETKKRRKAASEHLAPVPAAARRISEPSSAATLSLSAAEAREEGAQAAGCAVPEEGFPEQEETAQVLSRWREFFSREIPQAGTLYLVGTPIGNLADMSPRALAILAKADRIACEDCRRTGLLLKQMGLSSRHLLRADAHREEAAAAAVLRELEAGGSVALVSDAGMPLISDPGHHLVRRVLEAGFALCPISGPTAGLCALAASGLDASRYYFAGFLASKKGRRTQLQSLLRRPETVIFYESPGRVGRALRDLLELGAGRRRIVLAREISKKFETFYRGEVCELAEKLRDRDVLGECVLLLEGEESLLRRGQGAGTAPAATEAEEGETSELAAAQQPESREREEGETARATAEILTPLAFLRAELLAGHSAKDAVQNACRRFPDLRKREIFKMANELKREAEEEQNELR